MLSQLDIHLKKKKMKVIPTSQLTQKQILEEERFK